MTVDWRAPVGWLVGRLAARPRWQERILRVLIALIAAGAGVRSVDGVRSGLSQVAGRPVSVPVIVLLQLVAGIMLILGLSMLFQLLAAATWRALTLTGQRVDRSRVGSCLVVALLPALGRATLLAWTGDWAAPLPLSLHRGVIGVDLIAVAGAVLLAVLLRRYAELKLIPAVLVGLSYAALVGLTFR